MATSTAVAKPTEADAQRAVIAELDHRLEVIQSSAASLIDPVRLKGVFLSQFSRRPELWECDPISIARAVVEAAQVGLEPTGAIGGAHLVPRWNSRARRMEATLVFDYRGLVTLARRSGEIARVVARVVREHDEFAYQQGTEEWIRHVPALVTDPGPYAYVYAVAFFRDGGSQFDVMSAAQIQHHMERYAPRDRERNIVGPWITDPEEMWKKTVLRRLSKLLPLTVEARQAIEFEDQQVADAVEARRPNVKIAKLRERIAGRLSASATNGASDTTVVEGTTEGDETGADSADALVEELGDLAFPDATA